MINDEHYFNKYKGALEDFETYLEKLNLYSTEAIDEYSVPTSTFWLINDKDVVGVVRIRHKEIGSAGHIGYDISPNYRNRGFGTSILKLALVEAERIGITEAVLTCNINNTYSRKVIEKNNGNFLGTIYDPEDDEYLYRYSITL